MGHKAADGGAWHCKGARGSELPRMLCTAFLSEAGVKNGRMKIKIEVRLGLPRVSFGVGKGSE